jgi:putative proteasome-type protease
MTYCLAIKLDAGLVLASDSRTNAGVDQISTYSKMHAWGIEGERQFILLSAGNLATTQAVVTRLHRDIEDQARPSLATVRYMTEAAEYVGSISIEHQSRHSDASMNAGFNPEATFILGGQIKGDKPGLFLVYPQGNYITTPETTPFLQIGEIKYGKPILDRVIHPDTPIEDAMRCALVSMDSTMRSNVTVGPPIELAVYRKNTFSISCYQKFESDDPYLLQLKASWDASLMAAFRDLPRLNLDSLCSGAVDSKPA